MTYESASVPKTPLVTISPLPVLQVCVIVPVRNEARRLAGTLRALYHQTDGQGNRLDCATYEVLILANNCRDDSAPLVRDFARRHPDFSLHLIERELPPPQAHVGYARRLLMDEAARRLLGVGRPRGIIASTDGDTRVAPTWVSGMIHEVARGADAVGGRILVGRPGKKDPSAPASGTITPGRRYHLLDVGYRLLRSQLESRLDPDPADLWPRHYQMFGASLALTAETYERVGGLPVLPSLEDVALYRALKQADARIRHSPLVRVHTSGRSRGRTPWGMAAQLRLWGTMEHQLVPFRVESGLAATARFRAKRALRQRWRSGPGSPLPVQQLAETLCLEPPVLTSLLALPHPFGSLWEAVQHHLDQPDGPWQRRWPLVDIRSAIRELRHLLGKLPLCPLEPVEPVGGVPLPELMT
ncbi:MAG: glycosyltransferase [Ferruginibacter sp.]|nr:glycosyltransferase [Cytophagales bacterium]